MWALYATIAGIGAATTAIMSKAYAKKSDDYLTHYLLDTADIKWKTTTKLMQRLKKTRTVHH